MLWVSGALSPRACAHPSGGKSETLRALQDQLQEVMAARVNLESQLSDKTNEVEALKHELNDKTAEVSVV